MYKKKQNSQLKLILSTCFLFSLFNLIEIPVSTIFFNAHLDVNQQALAKSRGGRSGGGSFKSRSSSRSKTKTSSSSNRKTSSYTDKTVIIQNKSYHRSYGFPLFYGYGYGGGSSLLFLLIFFSFFGFIAYLVYAQSKTEQRKREKVINNQTELENEEKNRQVTISKLQIALTGEAKTIAKQLSHLSLSIDTNTEKGLVKLLQESILILLRNKDYWTHVLSRSFTVKIDKAEAVFNRLSIAERSKFSAETLSNFNEQICKSEYSESENNQQLENSLLSHFIITILVGSTGEEALFYQLHSIEELRLALEKLTILDEDNLLKLEILWTPQSENEFLTNDEFIMEYTDMIQLV